MDSRSVTMKGIVLAGGMATRFHPATQVVSKQLLCVYDKPLIYYALTSLFSMGIRNIALITTEQSVEDYRNLLGDGRRFGVEFTYLTQSYPGGIAQAFLIASRFLEDSHVCLILGDNIFIDAELSNVCTIAGEGDGAFVLAARHRHPSQYGVISRHKNIISLEEKPHKPQSHYIVPGLYFYDTSVIEMAKLTPVSRRGELEITDINKQYLEKEKLNVVRLNKNARWFDAGSPENLYRAARLVRHKQRTGHLCGCPEAVAYRKGWIGKHELEWSINQNCNSYYGKYLKKLI